MQHGTLYAAERAELLPFVPVAAREVLDIGCGAGGFGRALLRARPGVSITGIEMEPTMAAAAEAAGYERVVRGAFPHAAVDLPDHSFDAILMFDVLEHMVDPEEALRAARRLLAADGRVVASIPNARHVRVWVPLVRRGRWDYLDSGLMDRTHLRWFTKATMVEMFERCGWQVRAATGINRASTYDGSNADTLGVRAISWLTGRRADAFLHAQYVIEAQTAH